MTAKKETKHHETFDRLAEIRKSYETTKDAEGKKHIDCGDEIAAELRLLTLDEIFQIAEDIGLAGLRAKYAALNNGQKRMNLGNRLRAIAKAQNVTTLTKLQPIEEGKTAPKAEAKKAAPKAKASKADKIERDAAGVPLPEATKGKKRGKKAA